MSFSSLQWCLVSRVFQFFLTFRKRKKIFPRTFHDLWQTCKTQWKYSFMSFPLLFWGLSVFSNIYFVIVIALSSLVLVLLIVISLLAWRLRRALNYRREKTPQGHTSDEKEQRDSTRDQHVPEEMPYMELKPGPVEESPRATSNYQSLKGAGTSPAYYNAGFKLGKSNQEDEIYYEIGNAQC